MHALFDSPGNPLASMPPDAWARIGTPRAEISHEIDISPWSAQKQAAIAAHRTQTADGGPLSEIPTDLVENQLRREHFIRAPLPWSISGSGDEPDLIELLARAQPAG
jgi:LmbE family N-acetylglucosaminyl deacetylase